MTTWTRTLRWAGALALAGFLGTAFTPLTNWLHRWIRVDGPSERAGAVVVLGGGGMRTDGTLSDSSLRRAYIGIRLYQDGRAPLVVFLGPAGFPGGPSEAEARATLARNCGVPADALLTEVRGRTTREEGVRVRALLEPRGIRKVVLVADSEGMGRAKAVFERVGFEVIPASAADVDGSMPEGRFDVVRRVAMELIARVYYRFAGYL